MNIVLAEYQTEKSIVEINDASSSQVSAYISANMIQIKGEDWYNESSVMNYEDNTLYIFVSLSNSFEDD